MAERSCPACGASVSRDSDFCLMCGEFLNWSDADPGPAPTPDRAAATTTTMTAPRWLTGTATAATAPPRPAPEPGGCPRCGIANPPRLRFCRRCALEFRPATAPAIRTARPGGPAGWWSRLTGRGRTPAERDALRAYRRSLPLRYRLFRAAGGLVTVAVLVAAVLAVRGDPVGWLRDRWYDVRDRTDPVAAQAVLDPPAPERPEFPAGFAVDNQNGTAWGTAWSGAPGPAPCGTKRTAAGLRLTLERPADLREIRVLAGLPTGAPERLLQWRPRSLEVRTADGACQLLPLKDTGVVQDVALLAPLNASVVRIDVADVYPRAAGSTLDVVAISEITLLARPAH